MMQPTKQSAGILGHSIGMLVLLALQFVFGMIANLFVTIPASHPGSSGSDYLSQSASSLGWALSNSGGVIEAHAGFALLIVIGMIALFIRTLPTHKKSLIWLSLVAALAAIGAFMNGLSFVDYGHDFSSLIMALCWLVAVLSLVAVIFVLERHPATNSSHELVKNR